MMEPLEVKLKLEFDPADRDRLATRLFDRAACATEHLVANYFDTPRRDVRDAGYSLRIRREGGQRIQTIKAHDVAAGLFARAEWEREMSDDTPLLDPSSGPLAEVLPPAALDCLDRVFVTDVERTRCTVQRAASRIECAIDNGEIRAGKWREALCEVELELESGFPRALFDIARRLDEEVPLRLGVASKAERGYRLAEGISGQPAKAEAIALQPDSDVGDSFQAIVRSCLRQFRRNETILLGSGTAEPLHQARVGLRRLRTAFSLYRPLLDGDSKVELFTAELRWLAGELGKVRNLDILIARAGPELRDQLMIARERTFAHVRAELASARTRLLMIDLAEWLVLGKWCADPRDPVLLRRSAAQFASEALGKRHQQLRHRARAIASLDDAHRHKVRIAAKKLRYASEFFAALYPARKARRRHAAFLEAIEKLQDHLGEINDLVTGPRLLARLDIDAPAPDTGKHDREKLLRKAEAAYEALIDAKRFWH